MDVDADEQAGDDGPRDDDTSTTTQLLALQRQPAATDSIATSDTTTPRPTYGTLNGSKTAIRRSDVNRMSVHADI